ncbi:hypothetical protein IFO69_20190 [Echinicola sp. CAU 1574]|uniref:Uncharacterized protein n=1 Tax=Echinicola arenosa TaxID=2774144 RepID=A0ABR9AQN1_9BACT|nr:hypothetical protein [Echinicola arenosa]MBD8491085.1 hypothetical protein [Echinicola arenosa]
MDVDRLDYRDEIDFIIPRVLDKGLLFDCLDNLEQLYSLEAIQYFCKNSSQVFGNEKIKFLAKKYRLKPKQFLRYDPNIEL